MANAHTKREDGEQLYPLLDKAEILKPAPTHQYRFDIDEGYGNDGIRASDWDEKEQALLKLDNQTSLRPFRTASKYMHESQIHTEHEEVSKVDVRKRDNEGNDSNALELSQLMDCDNCIDKRDFHEPKIPNHVPISDIRYVSGDSEAIINKYTAPNGRSHKRHNIVSYHLLRIMGACGYTSMDYLRSESNVSDVISQHWGHKNSYERLWKQTFRHNGNLDSPIQHDVLRDNNEDKYDPAKQSIVYLIQKMGSAETMDERK